MRFAAVLLALTAGFAVIGCEEKKVVDVEGPGVDLEVEEDGDASVNVGED